MKIIFVYIFFLIFISITVYSQNKNAENTIYAKISLPVFVDRINKINHSDPKYKDVEEKWENSRFPVYADIINVSIDAGHTSFVGSYKDPNYPYADYNFFGRISIDRTLLSEFIIRKSINYKEGGFEFTEKFALHINDMPLKNGIGQYSKEQTNISIENYEYLEVTRSQKRTEYKECILKSIDFENILPPPFGGNFNIRVNIDGPASYIISENDIRGENPTWQPPAALNNPANFGEENEPNSIGFYPFTGGLDKESEMWTNYASKLLFLNGDLLNIRGLKVLERAKIDKINNEIELSESGLVSEESMIKQGNLLKEEVAVITCVDLSAKKIEYTIQSKKLEKIVTVTNVTTQNLNYAAIAARIKVYQIINNSLTEALIPPIYDHEVK